MQTDAHLVLTEFKPVQLSEPIAQEKVYDVLSWAIAKSYCVRHSITDDDEANRVLHQTREQVQKYAISPKYVRQRQGVLTISPDDTVPEYLRKDGGYARVMCGDVLFRDLSETDTHPDGLSLKERMKLFDRIVSDCFEKLYQDEQNEPDDLIHVTCSGYVSPSPAERLISKRSWGTTVTHCYHMGCYAFFPGMRMAAGAHTAALSGFTAPKRQVDVVHTELLSLHMKLSCLSPEEIITQTLFSDGFIKYSMVPENVARQRGGKGLRLLTFKQHIIPDSLDDMTWVIGDHQFDMTLAVQLPFQIAQNIGPFLNAMFQQIGRTFEDEREALYFAIHPGGPRIVDCVCCKLGLRRDQVEYSYRVLYEHGNMSSATIAYLLNDVLHDDRIPDDTLIPAFAFGPGLTISGAIFQKVNLDGTV